MSVRGFNFNSIPMPKLKRSAFDLSHEFKAGIPMGKLVPFLCFEGLPGDSFKIKISQITRFMALQAPMMQRVDVKMEFYKVPVRLIYKEWESFVTGGVDGTEKPSMCHMNMSAFAYNDITYGWLDSGSLAHYLGIPMPYRLTAQGTWEKIPRGEVSIDQKISLLPFNAYHKIYNDYYRDQNLIDETELADEAKEYKTSAGDFTNNQQYFKLHNRAWKKDYFTSALNDPQRGQAVAIGLTGTAPLTANSAPVYGDGHALLLDTSLGTDPGDQEGSLSYTAHTAEGDVISMLADAGSGPKPIYGLTTKEKATRETDPIPSHTYADLSEVEADMSQVSAMGIIALRTAFKLQQFLERNNIAGSRLVESVAAHFGVRSSDGRMQRAEMIGRTSFPVMVTPVDSTADTATATIGEQGGRAKSVGGTRYFRTFCEEHCIIMGLVSIMPQAAYCQGLSRMWTRFDKFDYFWPEFQAIGEQAVKNREVFLDYEGNSDPDGDFGYQSRYSDYKFMPDRISGDMANSLNYWHMARLFSSMPGLNKDFIECNPTDRVFAVKDDLSEQHIVVDFWNTIKSVRPMAKYSTPRIS